MGILLYLYPNAHITPRIPLWVYHSTYILLSISLDLYPDGYITRPIPLWVYYPAYAVMDVYRVHIPMAILTCL